MFDESGEQGVYRSPPKKNKKNGVAQERRQVWRPHRAGVYHSSCKVNEKTRHDAQNREENDVFEDERYDMSEFLPKFAPVYPRRVSLVPMPMPAAARSNAWRGEGDGACVKNRGGGMAS